jgi:hypothetical protein
MIVTPIARKSRGALAAAPCVRPWPGYPVVPLAGGGRKVALAALGGRMIRGRYRALA